jgi:hypothetical protein
VAEYQELRLRFERIGGTGEYRVFASGPAGEAAGSFTLPYSDVEVENLVLKLSRPRNSVRRIDSSDLELVRDFGGGLFDAVFSGRVRDVYRSSLASARGEGCGMRISLALTGTPELMHVPWEYLYDDPAFLSISMWTPVVRYLDLATTRRPLTVEPPLRILAMVSSPTDVAQLDVGQERSKLEESLAGLVEQGAVEIRWLEQATLQALQRELRRADYHVFHYIGHGGYDRASEDGVLALEDGTGRSRLVSGMELGTILADEMTLRLAVLNACEGARSSVDDPFSGVATSLVRREIPAVIAMQLEITDRAAITFACELYAALADGYAVDAALAEARKAIFADDNEVEWATPVLFMRVPDGRIFEVAAPVGAHEPVPEPSIVATAPEAVTAEPATEADAPTTPRQPEPWPQQEPEPVPSPVVRERPADVPPVRLPGRLVALLAGAILVLALGIVVPWDSEGRSLVTPHFGPLKDSTGGFFTALSPLVIVLVATVATVMAARGRQLQLAAGLLIACGVAASAKYLGVLARALNPSYEQDAEPVSVVAFCLVVVSSLALILIGIQLAQLAGTRLGRDATRGRAMSLMLGAGAVLMLIGCLVPFNTGGTTLPSRAVVPDEGPFSFDAVVVGLALLGVALCLRYLPRWLAAGIVLALGIESAALWLRYIGVPVAQSSDVGGFAIGGLLGLAGAALALAVGVWLVRGGAEPDVA